MYTRKERLKKLGIDIALLLLGVVIVASVLYSFQTSFTLKKQKENSKIKFETATQRVETHQKEADEFQIRYDSFSQAKADTIAYFYGENPDKVDGIGEMATQWDVKELYLLDSSRGIETSNVGNVYSDSTAPCARSFRTTLTEDENHLHGNCTAA